MTNPNVPQERDRAILIAGAAVFSALVAAVEYLSLAIPFLRIPFPFLPQLQLKFDMAEIPAALSFFVYGLPVGILTSIIVPLTIIARGTSNPIGAWLKGLAVLATILGLAPLWRRNRYLAGALGTASRVFIMSFANLIVLPTLYGIPFEAALIVYTPWLGVFNALHSALTIGVAYIIHRIIVSRLPRFRM